MRFYNGCDFIQLWVKTSKSEADFRKAVLRSKKFRHAKSLSHISHVYRKQVKAVCGSRCFFIPIAFNFHETRINFENLCLIKR
jgi:hypothetical protein